MYQELFKMYAMDADYEVEELLEENDVNDDCVLD
jgi:hypothetical protein